MRHFKFRWMRPFALYNKQSDGMILPQAVVTVRKYPYMQHYDETKLLFERTVITQYEYIMLVDLWFVKIRVDWKGKNTDAKIKAQASRETS